MLTCVKMQLQSPSGEKGRLLSNCLSNMRLKLEISNVKARLKKFRCCFLKRVYCFFPVNIEYVIKSVYCKLEVTAAALVS